MALIQVSTRVMRRQLNLMGYRSRWLLTPQGRVHALDAEGRGEGPPLVLLHGLSASAVHFMPVLPALRKLTCRLIALDLPGHGASDRPASGLTSATMAAGLVAGLDGLSLPPFVLFGSSMGGFGAVRYAARRPERLAGLILCSPGGAPLRGAELHDFKRFFVLSRHADGLRFVDRFLSEAPPAPVRHALAWGVRRTMADPGVRSLLASVNGQAFLRPEELRSLAPPTYLIWGQRERLLPEASFRFFAENLPRSAWIERPAAFGHTPYLEHPRSFVARVETFLRERARPRLAAGSSQDSTRAHTAV